MIELIKKAMFTTLGYAVLTRDKVEELAKDFVDQGKLSKEEGEKLVDDILKRSKESQEEMNRKVNGLVREALERMQIPRTDDLAALRAELGELKARIEKLESQGE